MDAAENQPSGAISLIPLKLKECPVPERLSRWEWVGLFEKNGYERLLRALQSRAYTLGLTATPVHVPHQNGLPAPLSKQESTPRKIFAPQQLSMLQSIASFLRHDRRIALVTLTVVLIGFLGLMIIFFNQSNRVLSNGVTSNATAEALNLLVIAPTEGTKSPDVQSRQSPMPLITLSPTVTAPPTEQIPTTQPTAVSTIQPTAIVSKVAETQGAQATPVQQSPTPVATTLPSTRTPQHTKTPIPPSATPLPPTDTPQPTRTAEPTYRFSLSTITEAEIQSALDSGLYCVKPPELKCNFYLLAPPEFHLGFQHSNDGGRAYRMNGASAAVLYFVSGNISFSAGIKSATDFNQTIQAIAIGDLQTSIEDDIYYKLIVTRIN